MLLSSFILLEAARLGAPKPLLYRMAANIAVEALLGVFPVAGDVFDAAWKANQKNVRLLEDYFREPVRSAAASRRWILLAGASVIIFALGGCWLGFVLLRWLWTSLAG